MKFRGSILVATMVLVLSYVLFFLAGQTSTGTESEDEGVTTSIRPGEATLYEIPLITQVAERKVEREQHYEYDIFIPEVRLLQYPELAKTANDVIRTYTKDIIDDFVRGIDDLLSVSTSQDDVNANISRLDLGFQSLLLSPSIISLRFDSSILYQGSPHQQSRSRAFNYDLERRMILSPEDLFSSTTAALSFLSEYSRSILPQRIGEKHEEEDLALLYQGTEPTAENFREIALTKDGLLIIFNTYQVASYGRGVVTAPISLDDVREHLRPEIITAITLANTNIREATAE
jgi:hypothetical protein